jgi:phenylpropionate dioxygenase-like ring-hydroxylating dioxygenase large terminal subunit
MMDDVEYRLLCQTWFPVARSEDAARTVVEANILGTELVVFTVDGRVTVAEGRCPHRGMALWLGRIRGGCLECPYHGWLFEPGTGRCAEIPSLGTGETLPGVGLRTYPAVTAYGHVWTCLDEPYLPLPTLLDYDDRDWRVAFGVPRDVACGMRQITENFRDMAHFPFVHTGTMGPNVRRVVDPYQVNRDGWDLEWTLGTDLGGTALEGNTALGTRQTLTYRMSLPMTAYIRTRFPDGGRRLVAQFATPITPDGQRIRLFWVVGIDEIVADRHGVDLAEMWEYERQIFEEDVPIVENQRPAEAPLDPRTQTHTRADRFSLVYRATYRELLAEFAGRAANGAAGRPAVATG